MMRKVTLSELSLNNLDKMKQQIIHGGDDPYHTADCWSTCACYLHPTHENFLEFCHDGQPNELGLVPDDDKDHGTKK